MSNQPIIKDKSIKIWESNLLACAPTTEILHPITMKLFLWTIYKAVKQKKWNKDGHLEAIFNLKEFANYFNIDIRNTYSFAKKWTDKISNYKYLIKDNEDKDDYLQKTIIPTIRYKKGVITATFAKVANEHLLNLEKNKIYIELSHLKKIKNPRFIKLYEYLKAKVYSGQRNRIVNISIDNLYRLFVILDEAYPKFANFKQRVLKPIIKEFDKINDIKINKWEVIKLGNKISSVKFTVSNFSNNCLKEETKIKNRDLRCSSCCIGYFKPKRSESLETKLKIFDSFWNEELIRNDNDKYWKERGILEDKYEAFFYGCSNYPNCKKTLKTEEYDSLLNPQNKYN